MSFARVLVIGVSGQVGAALAEALGPSCLGTFGRTPVPGALHLDLAEIGRDPACAEAVLDGVRPDAVVCCAAMTNVDACEDAPEQALLVNAAAPAALARAAARRTLPFVGFSTDYVFDGRDGPYSEDAPPAPLCVYGRAKLEGERRILASHPGALVVRTTVVFGPDPRGRNFAYSVAARLHSGQELRVPNDQLSTPTYNRDLASAITSLLDRRATGIVHVAGEEWVDREEFARRLARQAGLEADRVSGVPTRDLQQRAPRPLRAGLRPGRLRELVPGWRPRTIEAAISDWRSTPRGVPWP